MAKYFSPGASLFSDFAFVCDFCESADGRPVSCVESSGAAICVECAIKVVQSHDVKLDFVEVRRAPVPESLRNAVFDRDGRKCQRCGATDDLTLDHINPFARGGATTYDNLQTLCRSCNSAKGTRRHC